jgi:hypothetical protein
LASHTHANLDNDRTQLPPRIKTLGVVIMAAGAIALVLAVVLTFALPHDVHHETGVAGTEVAHAAHHAGATDHETPARRFYFSYLFGIAPFLCLSCAALIFVLVHHLVKAGWVANVRRVMETFAVQLPLLSLLLIPIIGTVIWQKGTVYSWAKPHDTPVVHHGSDDAHGGQHEGHHEGETPEEHAKHMAAAGKADSHDHAGEHPGHHDGETAEEHAKNAAGPATAKTDATAEAKTADQQHEGGQAESHDVHSKPGVASVGPEGSPTGDRSRTQSPMSQGVFPRGPLPAQEYPNEQVRPGVARDFDAIIKEKNGFWLNPIVWTIRIPIYLLIVSGVAFYFHRNSVKQDVSGDVDISSKLLTLSAPLLMASALVVTFIAFDVFMSLDPHWFSTMYGVYFFASGAQAMWAALALTLLILQGRGYLRESVSREHFHDIGKWMWAFIFFFAYIAFSQYMLQWYANLPEETFWYDKRGYSTQRPNGYSILVLTLLFGRLVIPFAGLLSRHVKRNRFGLGFWAGWLLVMFIVDMYLLVMPEYAWVERYHMPPFGIVEILCLLGVGALWVGNVVRMLATYALRAVRDPRVHESMAVANI